MKIMIKRIFGSHNETVTNFFWRSIHVLGNQGITLLIFLTCAKLLTVYDFGRYNYLLTIIILLTIFGDCGISIATSKFVAEYNAINKVKLRLVLFNSGLIILIISVCIYAVILLFGRSIFGSNYRNVLLLLPLIFLVPMTSLYDGIYVGLKRFKLLALISLAVGFCSLSFVYILIKRYGFTGALVAQNLFYILLFVSLAAAYRGFSFTLDRSVLKDIGGYSILIGIANVGIFLYFRFDVLILGLFNYINEIAFYELANKILLFLVMPWTILSQVVAPDITRAFSEKNMEMIRLKLAKFTRLSLLYGTAISIIAFLTIKPLISLYLPDYNKGIFYLFFSVMMFILPMRLLGTVLAGSFIIPTGNAKILTYINMIFGVSKIAINFAVIMMFGVVGILISTLVMDYASVLTGRYFITRNITRTSGVLV